jgi:hypothetical protein
MILTDTHRDRIAKALERFGDKQDWAAIKEEQYQDNRRKVKKGKRMASGLKTEHEEQCEVVGWLRAKGLFFFAVPNGVSFGGDNTARARYANYLKAEGLSPGVPDLVIVGMPMVGLEMKRKGPSSVSDKQYEWHDVLVKNGWVVMVAHGADEAIRMLEEHYEPR